MATKPSSLLPTVVHDDTGWSEVLYRRSKDRLYHVRIREVALNAEEAGLVRDSCQDAARRERDLVAVGCEMGGNGIAYVRTGAQDQRYFRHTAAWDGLLLKLERSRSSSTSIAT